MKLSDALDVNISEVKNIIFDWGGVITDLDIDAIVRAFKMLGHHRLEEVFLDGPQRDHYLRFETGKTGPGEFLDVLREHMEPGVTHTQILDAWNTLLSDLPHERWTILKGIASQYRIFLLSNTNSLHVAYYRERLAKRFGGNGFEGIFEKTYYSHLLGMRKPDREIFEFVLEDSRLVPDQTLFIDDNQENIAMAKELGMMTLHLVPPLAFMDIFR